MCPNTNLIKFLSQVIKLWDKMKKWPLSPFPDTFTLYFQKKTLTNQSSLKIKENQKVNQRGDSTGLGLIIVVSDWASIIHFHEPGNTNSRRPAMWINPSKNFEMYYPDNGQNLLKITEFQVQNKKYKFDFSQTLIKNKVKAELYFWILIARGKRVCLNMHHLEHA